MGKMLVTGGLGYIGSHTVVELINQGYEPLIIDNLSTSDIEVLARIEKIVGKKVLFEQVEMCNYDEMYNLFREYDDIESVIHFAAFLLVGESVEDPLKYYHNNIASTVNLLSCMREFDVQNIVFSSSCTVYGNPETLPVDENAPIQPAVSPYGNTKQMGEDIIRDTTVSSNINAVSLRYFNPIGAHSSSIIGEFQDGVPHHLVPYITETALGKRKQLNVFGGDWNTPDGTCVRDYIHVVDIAKAHISAVDRLVARKADEKFEVFNLGTGIGYSVLDLIKAFINSTGLEVPYEIVDTRPGDVEAVYADTTKANNVLGWKAELSLETMLKSAWDWEQTLASEE